MADDAQEERATKAARTTEALPADDAEEEPAAKAARTTEALPADDAEEPATKAAPTSETLPSGWSAHVDSASGATYYWNASLGATSWERPSTPAAQPAGSPSHAAYLQEQGSSAEYAKMLGTSGTSNKWVKHSDPESGIPYFFNTTTNETQWEVPAEGFIDATVFGPTASTKVDDYAATASFNSRAGTFTAGDGSSYWQTHNMPSDREGRMMAQYFDLSTLEQNRKEAQEKKQKVRPPVALSRSSQLKRYDWRKYKEIKKKEKVKRRVSFI